MAQNEKNNQVEFDIDCRCINPVFLPALDNPSRYLHLYGGAGSGKSFFAAQKIIIRCLKETGHRFILARKVARTIRNSQFSLLKALIYSAGLSDYFRIREGDLYIKCIPNRNEIISAGLDDREKLKSIHGITSVWIEEATELDFEDFNQLDLRLRGHTPFYKQIILTYNPVIASHWLNTKHYSDSCILKTTYLDNRFIDAEYSGILNNLKQQDEDFYKIYALGEWGTLGNIIFKPFEILKNYPSTFDETIYGLDFGFNNESALIEVGILDSEYYLTEKIYEKKLTNSDLIKKMMDTGIRKRCYLYCDSAESARIAEIRRAGYLTYPSDKSVKDGIDFLKTCKIYSLAENRGLNKEVLSYSYKQDKNGNVIDEPVKFNDHALDAVRYAIYTHCHKRKGGNIRILG